jgi:hypothetical protein
MLSYRNGKVTAVPLKEATGPMNLVDVDRLYDVDRYNGRRSILNNTRQRGKQTGGVCAAGESAELWQGKV